MATIPIVQKPAPVQITKFLGLNSAEISETQLQLGEACDMNNIRIAEGYKLEQIEGYIAKDAIDGYEYGSRIFKLPFHLNGSNNTYEDLVYMRIKKFNDDGTPVVDPKWEVVFAEGYTVDFSNITGDGDVVEVTDTFSYKNKSYMVVTFYTNTPLTRYTTHYVEITWDGSKYVANDVVPYVPLIAIGTLPTGGGVDFEQINLLTNKKRQSFSPDGTATKFVLREKGIKSVDKVIVDGTEVTTGFTSDLTNGEITFTTAPTIGSDTIEIAWTGDDSELEDMRKLVLDNKNHIFYGDGQDTYLFLYGNPNNAGRITYTGIGDLTARVDYFPANNFITIGDGTKQITGIVKQYDRLVISLFDSMYYAQYVDWETKDSVGNEITLSTLKNFPLNDTIGCKQSIWGNKTIMALLDNSPVVINEKGMYVVNQTNVRAETNVQFISQRVQDWLDKSTITKAYDLESKHEYWINGDWEEGEWVDAELLPDGVVGVFHSKEELEAYPNPSINDIAILENYADDGVLTQDSYRYTNQGWNFRKNEYKYANEWMIYNYELDVFYKFSFYDYFDDIIEIDQNLYVVNSNGLFVFDKDTNTFGKGKYDHLVQLDENNEPIHDKLGRPIISYWEMGYFNFGYEYKRKMLTRIWVSCMPFLNSNIDVDLITDRGAGSQTYPIDIIMANFSNVNFGRYSFDVVYNPKPRRLKAKAKKFVYLKVKLSNKEFDTKFKVLQLTMQWQLGGEAK